MYRGCEREEPAGARHVTVGDRRNSSAPDLERAWLRSASVGSALGRHVDVQQGERVRADRDPALLQREQTLGVEQLLVQVLGGVVRGELPHEQAGELTERAGRETLLVEHHLGRPQVRLVEVAHRQDAHRVDGGRLHAPDVLDVKHQVAVLPARAAHRLEGGAQVGPELEGDEQGPLPVRLVERLGRVVHDGGGAGCGDRGHRSVSSEIGRAP